MAREVWMQMLLIGAGGFAGAILRTLAIGWVQRFDPAGTFPYGTLAVNVAGSFLAGALAGYAASREVLGAELRAFLFLGLLGAFTTFSTFSFETLQLVREGAVVRAAGNVASSVVLCLIAVWLGYALGTFRSVS